MPNKSTKLLDLVSVVQLKTHTRYPLPQKKVKGQKKWQEIEMEI